MHSTTSASVPFGSPHPSYYHHRPLHALHQPSSSRTLGKRSRMNDREEEEEELALEAGGKSRMDDSFPSPSPPGTGAKRFHQMHVMAGAHSSAIAHAVPNHHHNPPSYHHHLPSSSSIEEDQDMDLGLLHHSSHSTRGPGPMDAPSAVPTVPPSSFPPVQGNTYPGFHVPTATTPSTTTPLHHPSAIPTQGRRVWSTCLFDESGDCTV
ncbi:MAG: hypothetical protein DHS80DRAFT_30957 [Piptocephalis tieghemiana]|nr:MAG: hypothetical protein DHS80DRAFT_30957 [Piptocephalis tieghemiana]